MPAARQSQIFGRLLFTQASSSVSPSFSEADSLFVADKALVEETPAAAAAPKMFPSDDPANGVLAENTGSARSAPCCTSRPAIAPVTSAGVLTTRIPARLSVTPTLLDAGELGSIPTVESPGTIVVGSGATLTTAVPG